MELDALGPGAKIPHSFEERTAPPLTTLGEVKKAFEVQDKMFMWNEMLQNIVSLPISTPDQARTRRDAIQGLAESFVEFARPICQTLVAEMHLPRADKSIKEASLGGIAGGIKFIHQGILYKFAEDGSKIYGGSKEGAGKAAKLEYRALQTLLELHMDGLHVPLQGVIQVQGYRIIACALLPISSRSLVYGSADGGLTVHNDSREFDSIAERIATNLFLAKHPVNGVPLWLAADVEGHQGTDGRLYILDTARLLPAEASPKRLFGAIIPAREAGVSCTSWEKVSLPWKDLATAAHHVLIEHCGGDGGSTTLEAAGAPPGSLEIPQRLTEVFNPLGATGPETGSGPGSGSGPETGPETAGIGAGGHSDPDGSMDREHVQSTITASGSATGDADDIAAERYGPIVSGELLEAVAATVSYGPVEETEAAEEGLLAGPASGAGADAPGHDKASTMARLQAAVATNYGPITEDDAPHVASDDSRPRSEGAEAAGGEVAGFGKSLHFDNHSRAEGTAVTPEATSRASARDSAHDASATLDSAEKSCQSGSCPSRATSGTAPFAKLREAKAVVRRVAWPRSCTIIFFEQTAAAEARLPLNAAAARAVIGLRVRGPVVLLSRRHKGEHLTRLLRPELLKRFRRAVSADAHSGFGRQNMHVFNPVAREATQFLIEEVIPEFASFLDSAFRTPVESGNPSPSDPASGAGADIGPGATSTSDGKDVRAGKGDESGAKSGAWGTNSHNSMSGIMHSEVISSLQSARDRFKTSCKTGGAIDDKDKRSEKLRRSPLNDPLVREVSQRPFTRIGLLAIDLESRCHEAGIPLRALGCVRSHLENPLARQVVLAHAVARSLRRIVLAVTDELRCLSESSSDETEPTETDKPQTSAAKALQITLDALMLEENQRDDQRSISSPADLPNSILAAVSGRGLSLVLRSVLLSKYSGILRDDEMKAGLCTWRSLLGDDARKWVVKRVIKLFGGVCSEQVSFRRISSTDSVRDASPATDRHTPGDGFVALRRFKVDALVPTTYSMRLRGQAFEPKVSMTHAEVEARVASDDTKELVESIELRIGIMMTHAATVSSASNPGLLPQYLQLMLKAGELAASRFGRYSANCGRIAMHTGIVLLHFRQYAAACGFLSAAVLCFETACTALYSEAVLEIKKIAGGDKNRISAMRRALGLQSNETSSSSSVGPSEWHKRSVAALRAQGSFANFTQQIWLSSTHSHVVGEPSLPKLDEKRDMTSELISEVPPLTGVVTEVEWYWSRLLLSVCLAESGHPMEAQDEHHSAMRGFSRLGVESIAEMEAVSRWFHAVNTTCMDLGTDAMGRSLIAASKAMQMSELCGDTLHMLSAARVLAARAQLFQPVKTQSDAGFALRELISTTGEKNSETVLSAVHLLLSASTSPGLLTSVARVQATTPGSSSDPVPQLHVDGHETWVPYLVAVVRNRMNEWRELAQEDDRAVDGDDRRSIGTARLGKYLFLSHHIAAIIADGLNRMGLAIAGVFGSSEGYRSAGIVLLEMSRSILNALGVVWPWAEDVSTEESFGEVASHGHSAWRTTDRPEYSGSLPVLGDPLTFPTKALKWLKGNLVHDALVLAADASLALVQPGLARVYAQLAGLAWLRSNDGVSVTADLVSSVAAATRQARDRVVSGDATDASERTLSKTSCSFTATIKASSASLVAVEGTSASLPTIRTAILQLYTGNFDIARRLLQLLLTQERNVPPGEEPWGELLFTREYLERIRLYAEAAEAYTDLGVGVFDLVHSMEACTSLEAGKGDADQDAALELCLGSPHPALLQATAMQRRQGKYQAACRIMKQCGLELNLGLGIPLRAAHGIGAAWAAIQEEMKEDRKKTDRAAKSAGEQQIEELDDLLALALDDIGISDEADSRNLDGDTTASGDGVLFRTPDGYKVVDGISRLGSPPRLGSQVGGHKRTIVDLSAVSDQEWGHGSAVVNACCRWLLPSEVNPIQMTAQVKYYLGGPDPIDYVNTFLVPEVRLKDGKLMPAHWLFITQGLSNIHDDDRQFCARGPNVTDGLPHGLAGQKRSGFGIELTLRLVVDHAEQTAPIWPLVALQTLARYLHQSRTVFQEGHFTPSLFKDGACAPKHVVFARDAHLPAAVITRNGIVEFLQVVGLLDDELQLAQQWSTKGVTDLLKQADHPRITCGALGLLDRHRTTSVFEACPDLLGIAKEKLATEGASSGSLGSHLQWMADEGSFELDGVMYLFGATITTSVDAINALANALQSRLSMGKTMSVHHTNYGRTASGLEPHGHELILVPEGHLEDYRARQVDLSLVSAEQPLVGTADKQLLVYIRREVTVLLGKGIEELKLSRDSLFPVHISLRPYIPLDFVVNEE